MSFAAIVMFVLFFIWSFIGMPLGYAMLGSGVVYFLVSGGDMGLVASQSLSGLYGDFVMLSVPLFIFAAELMGAGEDDRQDVRLRQPACRAPARGRTGACQHRR